MAKSGTKSAVGRPASPGARETREALVRAAVDALREVGFAGASAREIARRAGCNQGLVFYHFGSVPNLLLAALDEVSETRRLRYQEAVDRADGMGELVDTAAAVFEEDLDAGHMAVLAEMIAGCLVDRRAWPARSRHGSPRGAGSRPMRSAASSTATPLAAAGRARRCRRTPSWRSTSGSRCWRISTATARRPSRCSTAPASWPSCSDVRGPSWRDGTAAEGATSMTCRAERSAARA